MKNSVIKAGAFICCLLSFIFIINIIVWIWMAGKMQSKKLKIAGWGFLGILILWIIFAIIWEGAVSGLLAAFNKIFILLIIFVPTFIIFLNSRELERRWILIAAVKKNHIDVVNLDAHAHSEIELINIPKMIKSSQSLYGEKGEAVLRQIKLAELDKERQARQVKAEAAEKKMKEAKERAERKQKAENEKAMLKQAEAQAEVERVRTERLKLEAEKAKAQAEAEKARMETERMKMEAKKTEKELSNKENEKNLNCKKDEGTSIREDELHASSNKEQNFNIKKVDINSCSEAELATVPGIGIISAKKAIAARNENGAFQSIDAFISSAGIRKANIDVMKPYLKCSIPDDNITDTVKKHGRKVDL